MKPWTVPKLWDRGECWVLGGGPSIPLVFGIPEEVVNKVLTGKAGPDTYSPYLSPIHNKHIIGINNSYLLGEWVDFVFFGDDSWYRDHRRRLALWPGVKIGCAPGLKKIDDTGIKWIPRHDKKREGLSRDPDKVVWNRHSGGSGINLAILLGARRIYLLGFDMTSSNIGPHWHPENAKSPPYYKHLQVYPDIAHDAREIGAEIFNVSPLTEIKEFPIITLEEALSHD